MSYEILDLQTNLCIDKNSGQLVRGGILSSLIAAIVVSGCAAAYTPAPLPLLHPASPTAPEAPLPQPSQAFSGGSIWPAPAEEVSASGPHAGHDTRHGGH